VSSDGGSAERAAESAGHRDGESAVSLLPPALHHVALGTRDVERLAQFYRALFGVDEMTRHRGEGGELRSIWIELASGILMIEKSSAPEGRFAPRREGVGLGWFLLAFRVTAAQRERLEQRVEELGSSIESRSRHSSYFRDPDGNRLAISEYGTDE
jgi:catechol 2,3-dioxygenase-like lactoylglutathione lyase family enzyme